MTTLNEAFTQIAPRLDLDPAMLVAYAAEDTLGGWHPDPDQRQWGLGSMWDVEVRFIYALVRALRPARVLEIGIGNGCTTTHILTALARNGDGHLTSIDPHPYNASNVPEALRDRWSSTPQDGVAWLAEHQDVPFDMVIEDAMHSYEMTYALISQVQARLVISHDAEHAIEGEKVRQAWTDVYGSDYQTALIEPSDCGLAWHVGADPRAGWPRILYLPIIEPGKFHDMALVNKRGLLDALSKRAVVRQVDYLAIPQERIEDELNAHITDFRPTMLLTQLHGADRVTPDMLASFHARVPLVVNWSGDSWKHSLISQDMLALCRHVDFQLVAAPDVLPVYAEQGIRAAYWQIGYEAPVGALPNMLTYDIVFLANVINDKRRALMEFLRSLDGVSAGIYGDWEHADGHNTYNFGEGEALYRNAKIAIADNVYPDTQHYMSNRPIQALVAGGAVLLHQYVPGMEELSGLVAGVHYAEWHDFDDLAVAIRRLMKNDKRRAQLVQAGQAYALAHHTYANRVDQLFDEFLPEVEHAI